MKQSQIGDLIEVWSTDAGSAADIPEWINKVGHEYISSIEVEGVWRVLVRKKK
nr:sulfurtransferase TusA family protein [Sulfuriferula plumbiphila]